MYQRLVRRLQTEPHTTILTFGIPLIILSIVIVSSFIPREAEQFSELAFAFMHGHTNFLTSIGGYGFDPVYYHGKVYWDDGPFPSILLLPFVALFDLAHIFFYQGYIQWLLVLGVMYFVYKIARHLMYTKRDSVALMFGFTLGSVFMGVAALSSSWYLAQVITTLLFFAGLYEFLTRKRWWLLGILVALMVATRATAAATLALFLILELAWEKRSIQQKMMKITDFTTPIVVILLLLGLYNYMRFGNFFNEGNMYQLIGTAAAQSRSYGVFSLAHLPKNLYDMLVAAPVSVPSANASWILKFPYISANSQGMSIFLTSPYLLYLFTVKWSRFDARAKRLLISVIFGLLFICSYYGVGADQFGARYSLDFLPVLFVLFMLIYRKSHDTLTNGMKFLLLAVSVTNFYLLLTFT